MNRYFPVIFIDLILGKNGNWIQLLDLKFLILWTWRTGLSTCILLIRIYAFRYWIYSHSARIPSWICDFFLICELRLRGGGGHIGYSSFEPLNNSSPKVAHFVWNINIKLEGTPRAQTSVKAANPMLSQHAPLRQPPPPPPFPSNNARHPWCERAYKSKIFQPVDLVHVGVRPVEGEKSISLRVCLAKATSGECGRSMSCPIS